LGKWRVIKMNDRYIKEELFPILFLTIVVCVSVIALSIINSVTEDKIEEAKQNEIDDMLKEQFPEMKDSEYDDDIEVYFISMNNTVIGYAFMIEAGGYGGPIEILIALENTTLAEDDIILRGISIISNSETPGLGEKITETSFLEQFVGINVNDVQLKEDGGQIDAISGATISSSAVVDAIYDDARNKAGEILETREKGGSAK